jgi:cell division protein FtsZ
MADRVLKQGVESISELINVPSFINLDFADVRAIMKDAGYAHMGIGRAKGSNKAEEAAKRAISSPLLETSIDTAKGVIISITSSPDISLEEVEQAADLITSSADEYANIIFGTAFDAEMSDEIRITVIATGFDSKPKREEEPRIERVKDEIKSKGLDINEIITRKSPERKNKWDIDLDDDFTQAPAETPREEPVKEEDPYNDVYLEDVINLLKKNSSK